MSASDPVADMLTKVRNAAIARHEKVDIPASKLKVELARVLKEEGFIADYAVKEEGKFKVITITLKYDMNRKPVITKLERISKPGLRHYSKAKKLQKVLGGLGVAIISTPKGLLTDRKARKENVGGEILCYVY